MITQSKFKVTQLKLKFVFFSHFFSKAISFPLSYFDQTWNSWPLNWKFLIPFSLIPPLLFWSYSKFKITQLELQFVFFSHFPSTLLIIREIPGISLFLSYFGHSRNFRSFSRNFHSPFSLVSPLLHWSYSKFQVIQVELPFPFFSHSPSPILIMIEIQGHSVGTSIGLFLSFPLSFIEYTIWNS